MKVTKHFLLLASVCITGCAVLIVEIVAMRILSPYYGNTIYTTSSVIGIILTALSVGYWFGGKLADRRPGYGIFYEIIFISGFLVIFMQALATALLPSFSLLFSIVNGPFFASLLLFFTPAFCLGMLSPMAVALNKKDGEKMGSQSGEVFFWSTLGSIVGSISCGFLLIPHFGINAIVISTGVILALMGLLGVLYNKTAERKILPLLVLVFFTVLFSVWINTPKASASVLYDKDGVYEKIKITEGMWSDQSRTPAAVGAGEPVRFLFQDRSYSAAMYLHSDALVYDYTKYYALYKLIKPNATQSLVIGGGAYSIPKALLADSPSMNVDVAEIEPELYGLAKTYFHLHDDPRLHNYTQDGRQLLAENTKPYDVIVSDVYYSLFSIPVHFTTKEFFSLAKSRLSQNGVFVGNFAGDLYGSQPSLILSEMKTFQEVFPNSYFFAVVSPTSPQAQNIIFMGINGSQRIDFSSDTVTQNTDLILQNLKEKLVDTSTLPISTNYEMTDNFSPVEYLVGKVVNEWH